MIIGRRYPNSHGRQVNWKTFYAVKEAKCGRCGGTIARGDSGIIIVTTQVSWFRGEDEVEWFHHKCWNKRKQDGSFKRTFGETTGV